MSLTSKLGLSLCAAALLLVWVVLGPLGEDRVLLLKAGALAAALALLLALGLSWWLLSPLGALLAAARKVAQGDFRHRLPETRGDELGQLAAEFNRMTARLAELDDLKAAFLSRITHDLKNPLSALLGSADLLDSGAKGALTEEQARCVRSILGSAGVLARMIDDALYVAQLEAGRVKLRPEPAHPADLVDPVVSEFKPRADELKIGLSSHIAPDLEEVLADGQAFRQVLGGLLSNALAFTMEGGAVSIKAYPGGRGEAVFVVSETGIGIPKERLGTLFAKFSQVPETRNKVRPSSGAGLGLAISKLVVDAHGGRIWAESELFKGSSFYFTLPRRAAST